MIDLTNLSEGCNYGSICARNIKATGVTAQLPNLLYTTYALQQRDCIVGNSRLMEMVAAVEPYLLAFQPPCIPTDWQAKQIAANRDPKLDSPNTVYCIADDTFDLGCHSAADNEPVSEENAQLTNQLEIRTPLHLWAKSGAHAGKIRFEGFRVITNLTLDRAVTEIRAYYANEIRTIEQLGGRIPHTVVIVWTGRELKVRIAGETDLGSIRPNLHTALHSAHRPTADSFNCSVCKRAARQAGELNRWFQGVAILFAGCAEIFHLDTPGVNGRIDSISDGRSTYVKRVAEIMNIMQDYGVTCFPCSSPE